MRAGQADSTGRECREEGFPLRQAFGNQVQRGANLRSGPGADKNGAKQDLPRYVEMSKFYVPLGKRFVVLRVHAPVAAD